MARISAVINARNEEGNIRYCLESVKWCDEIVVVDMESEDKTATIARQYTDKVFAHERVLAFDAARKFAVAQATGDWILLVDADEMVPRPLSEKLREIAGGNDADVVYVAFKTYIMGEWIKHAGWWPQYHPRFFRRGCVEFVETIHAFMQVNPSAREIHLPAEEGVSIEHFNYVDCAHFVKKLNHYTTIEAEHLHEQGGSFSAYRMFVESGKEFISRYFIAKGYKDGHRGLFLSMMMAFYRSLSYMKLWENRQNRDTSLETKYTDLKKGILKEYSKDA